MKKTKDIKLKMYCVSEYNGESSTYYLAQNLKELEGYLAEDNDVDLEYLYETLKENKAEIYETSIPSKGCIARIDWTEPEEPFREGDSKKVWGYV
jgi:hypothetical protein